MACPDCASTATTKRKGRTALGYRRFWFRDCRRRFNERTGTPFNDLQYPTDIVLLAVRWRLRYKLGFRDVAELLLQRGFEVTHETIRAWEVRFAPLLADQLRAKRRGQAGGSWYLDKTDVKVAGRWCYLYRAIDREGVLLDSMLSAHRDKHAARRFLRRLVDVAERKPGGGRRPRRGSWRCSGAPSRGRRGRASAGRQVRGRPAGWPRSRRYGESGGRGSGARGRRVRGGGAAA